jgi:hypothetical protein
VSVERGDEATSEPERDEHGVGTRRALLGSSHSAPRSETVRRFRRFGRSRHVATAWTGLGADMSR